MLSTCANSRQSSPSVFFSVCLFPVTQDEEAIPVELRNLPEYKELLELKRLKKQTLREIQDDKDGVRHVGFKVNTRHTFLQHYDASLICLSHVTLMAMSLYIDLISLQCLGI